jgi:class 3 adenylate cyclase
LAPQHIVLAIIPANVLGGIALYLYFTYVDPLGGPVIDATADAVLFGSMLAVLVTAIWFVSRRSVQPIAEWYARVEAGVDPSAVPDDVRRRVLNAPIVGALRGLSTWLLAIGLYAAVQRFAVGMSWVDVGRVAGGVLFAGAIPAAAISFLIGEFHWRRRIPEFFPDGRLQIGGVVRVPVRVRLAVSFLLTAIVPLTVVLTLLVGVTLRFEDGMPEPVRTLWTRLLWATVYVVVTTSVASAVVALFVARFINRPILALRKAMRAVATGDLEARVPVRSPDELGELNQHFNAMVRELQRAAEARELFGRYVSPEVARRALERGVELGGEEVTATALFADLRGFTARSEALSAPAVVTQLAEYYAVVERVCQAEHGIITQFLGDGVVVIFGAPLDPVADHADRAVRAARAIQRLLGGRVWPDGEPLAAGIGICTGDMIAGNVGAGERLIYTIVGDPVNQAARLQVKTRDLHATILLTESTRAALREVSPDGLRFLGKVALKGIASGVAVYAADE